LKIAVSSSAVEMSDPWLFGLVQLEAGPTHQPRIGGVLLGAALCILALAVFDVLVARFTKARWFAVHAIANAWVVVFSVRDMLRVIVNPFAAGIGAYSLLPLEMIVAVHLYHVIAFRNLRQEDYVHHFLFAGVMGMFATADTVGPVSNFICFFVSGLPGGLDYAMLFGVKHGWFDPVAEKVWATRLNVWMRSPGLQIGSLLLYAIAVDPLGRNHFRHDFTAYLAIISAALTFLNGTFYMQQVTVITARKSEDFQC
jgi:hypothetical protein